MLEAVNRTMVRRDWEGFVMAWDVCNGMSIARYNLLDQTILRIGMFFTYTKNILIFESTILQAVVTGTPSQYILSMVLHSSIVYVMT